MGNRVRLALIVVAVAVTAALLFWWALPRLVAALPGRVRQYVPEAVVERVTTPLPTALPAPTGPTHALLVVEPLRWHVRLEDRLQGADVDADLHRRRDGE